jgi:hypothetical protein
VLKLQALFCLPPYIGLLARPYWSTGRRLLIIISDLAVVAGIVICLSIDDTAFVARLTEWVPAWENFDQLAGTSAIVLYVFLAAIAWDIADHGNKIRREMN